jgi:hypothetical protein
MIAACLISVLMLALAGATRFGAQLQGAWHVIYVVSAGAALYFNLLLGVAGASSQTEPSLLVAQFAVVLPFVGVTVAIIMRFRRAALAGGELRLENPGQVLVNQRTGLNEDTSHDFRERSARWPR